MTPELPASGEPFKARLYAFGKRFRILRSFAKMASTFASTLRVPTFHA